jgi:hypothetical protein
MACKGTMGTKKASDRGGHDACVAVVEQVS